MQVWLQGCFHTQHWRATIVERKAAYFSDKVIPVHVDVWSQTERTTERLSAADTAWFLFSSDEWIVRLRAVCLSSLCPVSCIMQTSSALVTSVLLCCIILAMCGHV